MAQGISDATPRGFAAAAALLILAANGLDWAGFGRASWLAVLLRLLVFRLIASRGLAAWG